MAETVPIIRCPKGNAAEAVAYKLESKLRDNIINTRATLFPEPMSLSRPGIFFTYFINSFDIT